MPNTFTCNCGKSCYASIVSSKICLKIAKVIPVHKQGNKTDIGNYFPKSILSKILEKLICRRTHLFLEKCSILLPLQCGFRTTHSTTHVMLDIFTSLDNLNLNKNTALILLELRKVFNTVNHEILLSKLYHYGIRGNTNKLFASFLTNRWQYVFLNHTQCNCRPINCRVPQGSVLISLQFALYINDINSASNSSAPRLYADDT